MRPNRRSLATFVTVSVLAGAGATPATWPAIEAAPQPGREARAIFTVQGKVVGLYPGRVTFMKLRIRNPHPFPIKVRSIRARVADGAPGCPGSAIRVRRIRNKIVPAAGRARGQVRVVMRPIAPDACIGVRFPIRFAGRAVRA